MSEIFEMSKLLDERALQNRSYLEFLRVPAMSAGIYVLMAGAVDGQKPHQEDEIYYVVRGKAKIQLGNIQREVNAGDTIFLERLLEHRFFDIEEELVLLVIFAPAETD